MSLQTKIETFVSSLGFALGYLGGGILFLVNVLMYLYPEYFFLKTQTEGILYSFLTVAIWWFIFSIPLFLFVKQKTNADKLDLDNIFKNSFLRVFTTFQEIKNTSQY